MVDAAAVAARETVNGLAASLSGSSWNKVAVSPGPIACAIPVKDNRATAVSGYSTRAGVFRSSPVKGCCWRRPRKSSFTFAQSRCSILRCQFFSSHVHRVHAEHQHALVKLHPFALRFSFWPKAAIRTRVRHVAACYLSALPNVVAVLSSSSRYARTALLREPRLPVFTGRNLLTTTGSSVTSHHVRPLLSFLLNEHYPLLTLRLWES
jgi:hypothetical protein